MHVEILEKVEVGIKDALVRKDEWDKIRFMKQNCDKIKSIFFFVQNSKGLNTLNIGTT